MTEVGANGTAQLSRRHSAPQIESQVSDNSATSREGDPKRAVAPPQPPKRGVLQKAGSVAVAPETTDTEMMQSGARPVPKARGSVKECDPDPPRSLSPDSEVKAKSAVKPERPPPPRRSSVSRSPPPNDPFSNKSLPNFYRAKQDYQAQHEGEISFSKGDVVVLIDGSNPELLYGTLDNGTTGLFPVTCLEPFPSQ